MELKNFILCCIFSVRVVPKKKKNKKNRLIWDKNKSLLKYQIFSVPYGPAVYVRIAQEEVNNKAFPPDFLFGTATASYQAEGTADKVNLAGVNYYKNVLKELKDNDIEPMVTIYDWNLPQVIQEQGGWPEDSIVELFADYARVCFELFGESVKYWLTFTEPLETCLLGYGDGTLAPAFNQSGILDYKCTHNLVKAHARAWHIYDKEFRAKQNGKVSIALDTNWFEPEDNSPENEEAAETKRQFTRKIRSVLCDYDFDSDNRTRTPKISVEYFKKIVATHCLVDACEEA